MLNFLQFPLQTAKTKIHSDVKKPGLNIPQIVHAQDSQAIHCT